MLASFAVICFADLKKYKFTYLFAFPALHSDPSWSFVTGAVSQYDPEGSSPWDESSIIHIAGLESAALVDCVQTWRYRVDPRQHGFFLAKRQRKVSLTAKPGTQETLKGDKTKSGEPAEEPNTPGAPGDGLDYIWSVGSLAEYERAFFEGIPPEDQFICFTDPSTYATYPGWMLRNLLVLIRMRWKLDQIQILCYRDVQACRDGGKSIILPLKLQRPNSIGSSISGPLSDSSTMPKVTGWERNIDGRVTSRVANLGDFMDPQRYVIPHSHVGTHPQMIILV